MKNIIESRLAKLPPKVAQPLKHLAKIGQMREEDIKTVLDAAVTSPVTTTRLSALQPARWE